MIITRLQGGMGNQMFQYAFARALAVRNNTSLGFDTSFYSNPGTPVRTYDLNLFSIDGTVLLRKDIPMVHRTYLTGFIGRSFTKIKTQLLSNHGKETNFHFDKNKTFLMGDAYLDGYWQSYKYFDSIAETIRADFTVRAHLPEKVQKLKDEIISMHSVCIHIRRGDYVGNSVHEVVNSEYYDRALELLKEKTIIDHLYVFSDDIAWCKEMLAFPYPTTYVGDEYAGERAIGHFALMQSCEHFIIPNSSFSWWAAWLATAPQKVVIAPKQWFVDDSIDSTDLIPPAWIRI